jgi:glycosyltransferase involved in cell wall biosynthesis
MTKLPDAVLSIVVPVYNEGAGLPAFHDSLVTVLRSAQEPYEIIYSDDGSTDDTPQLVSAWHAADPRVRLISFSRNFGKDSALSAGIAAARGEATLMLDGDGQHPVEAIPEFIKAWKGGAQVVIGLRTGNSGAGWSKHLGSKLFHNVFNRLTGQKLVMGTTDFRLIDKPVRQAFLGLGETDRVTRGLIDWLGFRREYVPFRAKDRASGSSSYSLHQLMGLAANSFASLTPKPLYMFGYLGVFITIAALLLGGSVFVEQLLLADPWHWKFTGTAMLGILLLFLVGIILMSQGILSLYISHIHSQSKNRPLYVIDYEKSAGIKPKPPADES